MNKKNKKLLNDCLIFLYPLLTLAGVWWHQTAVEKANRTYELPIAQSIILELAFLILLGCFLYYFLVRSGECHLPAVIIGICEALIFLFLKNDGGAMRFGFVPSESSLVFGTVLTAYIVLFVKISTKKTSYKN